MMQFTIIHGLPVAVLADKNGYGPAGEKLLTAKQVAHDFGLKLAQVEDIAKASLGGKAQDYRLIDPPEPLNERDNRSILRWGKFHHLSDNHFAILSAECERRGISLWGDHVTACAAWPPGERAPILHYEVSIDWHRSRASATGQYAQLGPWWAGQNEKWLDCWISKENPCASKVGIKREGTEEPFWGIARWESLVEYIERDGKVIENDKWIRRGPDELADAAERIAIQRAFPETFRCEVIAPPASNAAPLRLTEGDGQ